MARKKKKPSQPRQKQPIAPPRFDAGTKVRVKFGVRDPDFPDFPLGGWSGTVRKVKRKAQSHLYLIEWDERTLSNMHPIYRKRCQRDDLDLESVWLEEKDFEPDDGEPVEIEQPTNIVTRPLRKDDQEDRIRAVFDLTSDDPLPAINLETLSKYHHYLMRHLTIPFQAKLIPQTFYDHEEIIIEVEELLEAEDTADGITCTAISGTEILYVPLGEIEVTVNVLNRQLIEDYSYWFYNWESDEEEPYFMDAEGGMFGTPAEPLTWRNYLWAALFFAVFGSIYGVVLGIILGAVEDARLSAGIGAFLLGLIGLVAGSRMSFIFSRIYNLRFEFLLGRLFGLIIGVLPGALIGALVVALVVSYLGAIIGAVAAAFVCSATESFRRFIGGTTVGILAGASVGAVVQLLIERFEGALAGALWGLLAGFVGGIVLYYLPVLTLRLLGRPPNEDNHS